MEWISNHIGVLVAVSLVAISVINAITEHFSEHKGLVKVLLFVSEVLSILVSASAKNGKLGMLKLPLQSVPPEKG
jgi:hypothetical protein